MASMLPVSACARPLHRYAVPLPRFVGEESGVESYAQPSRYPALLSCGNRQAHSRQQETGRAFSAAPAVEAPPPMSPFTTAPAATDTA